MAHFVVEHGSPVAVWGQVSRELRRQIDVGWLRPGEKLMTERELAEAYGVSRITVRQALEQANYLNTYTDAPLHVVKSVTEDDVGSLVDVSVTSWLGARVSFRYDRVHDVL